ncbi:MAG: extracellular solute-binding protein [Spirochaetes bacterium]|nr:extracellular solute-binding protein [Spirochaetota bacterium]
MKTLFFAMLSALIIFSQVVTYRHGTNLIAGSSAPVLYWVTDPNPARVEQVRLFRVWLKKKGYPDVEVRVDPANTGMQKTVVQGVTGVAGDLIDVPSPNLGFLHEMGILAGVTDLEKVYGYPDAEIWPALREEIFLADKGGAKQYGFPASFSVPGLMVNNTVFRSLGLEPPAMIETLDQWETQGRAFTKRANAGKKRQDAFFCGDLNFEALRRASGIATFNETFTACALGGPDLVALLKRYYRWIYDDHLMPTAAEAASFSADQGYGGATFQLLNKGNFAMAYTGRWALIQMRAMGSKTEWSATLVPHGGFPNAVCQTRAISLYAGTHNRELAHRFLGFLRSEEYNLHIVHDADALPPSPRFVDRPEYRTPAEHPNEWALHQGWAEIAKKYARTRDLSPYLLYTEQAKIENKLLQAFVSGVSTAEETARDLAASIDQEMRRFLGRHRDLAIAHAAGLEKQKKIDGIKASGGKVPLELIDNRFLRAVVAAKK